MLEIGGDLDLLQETIGSHDRSEFGPQHSDCYPAMMLHILGEVNCGHAPFAEFAFDAVAIGKGHGKLLRGWRHVRITALRVTVGAWLTRARSDSNDFEARCASCGCKRSIVCSHSQPFVTKFSPKDGGRQVYRVQRAQGSWKRLRRTS